MCKRPAPSSCSNSNISQPRCVLFDVVVVVVVDVAVVAVVLRMLFCTSCREVLRTRIYVLPTLPTHTLSKSQLQSYFSNIAIFFAGHESYGYA